MPNIKLVLEYDGSGYHGWQSQAGSGKVTIQETLEKALRCLTNEPVKTVSSGRTDAGVHAYGHVVNFPTSRVMPAQAWAPALNRLLPADIRVVVSGEVPDGFHARYSASGKRYRYRILNRSMPSALERNRAWHVERRLAVSAMRSAAAALIGKHDFSAFRSSSCNAKTPVRTLWNLAIEKSGDIVEITLEADAFLMHMARNITGTLVEIGLGRRAPKDMEAILRSRDRTQAGRTAPAYGLYLVQVFYPESGSGQGPGIESNPEHA
jgi:tRNA pseudouridine38-40 synthase